MQVSLHSNCPFHVYFTDFLPIPVFSPHLWLRLLVVQTSLSEIFHLPTKAKQYHLFIYNIERQQSLKPCLLQLREHMLVYRSYSYQYQLLNSIFKQINMKLRF